MSKSIVNNNIIINEPRGVRGMIISQRSDSSLNIFHSRKSPFVSMINVKDKLGLPPIKGTVINRKSLNNNIFHNNRLIKRKKEPSLEKYCSLKTAQQFWKKNINPYLEMNKDSNKYNMSSKEIKDQIELEEAEKKKECIDNKKFNRSSSCFNINTILKEENNNNNITNNKNESRRNNCSKHEEVTITKITKKSDIDNKPKEEEKKEKEEEKEPEKKEETKEENIDDILNDDEEKMDEAEMKDVLGYINSLDYEKYAKDMEIREALQLIKNKMEKDKEEQKEPITNTIQSNTTDTVPKETKEEEKLPERAEPKPVTPIINKEEEKKQEEIKQFKIAEKIAKDEVSILYLYIEIESNTFISIDKKIIRTTRIR